MGNKLPSKTVSFFGNRVIDTQMDKYNFIFIYKISNKHLTDSSHFYIYILAIKLKNKQYTRFKHLYTRV